MPEEVRADSDLRMNRRNLRIAAWALVLGVGIGLWQVCLAYREVHYGKIQVEQGEQTQQVVLDSTQVRAVMDELKSIVPTKPNDPLPTDSAVHQVPHACCSKHGKK